MVLRDTYYDILGVPVTAQPGEIKAKYRRLIQEVHPDLSGQPARFLQVQQAYEVLADPTRRAAYDREVAAASPAEVTADEVVVGGVAVDGVRANQGPPAATARPVTRRPRRRPRRPERAAGGPEVRLPPVSHYVAFAIALVGAELLLVGWLLNSVVGTALIALGVVTLLVAWVAAVGGRGAREREAYLRSGMAAVDVMTGRQLDVLLAHLFAERGFRVARLGVRGDRGADLVIDSAHGRGVIQVRHGTGVVRHDAVLRATVAMDRFGASHGLLVAPSSFSERAESLALSSGVTLWNRADLAGELSRARRPWSESGLVRFSSDFRAGWNLCLGFLASVLITTGWKAQKEQKEQKRQRPHRRRP